MAEPDQAEGGRAAADEKSRRLAEALRANLKRRKDQTRARLDTPPAAPSDQADREGDAGA